MGRSEWTDERLNEKMGAVDRTFDRLHEDIGGVREELRGFRTDFTDQVIGLRSDFSKLHDRLVQIGFSLVLALIGANAGLIVAVAQ